MRFKRVFRSEDGKLVLDHVICQVAGGDVQKFQPRFINMRTKEGWVRCHPVEQSADGITLPLDALISIDSRPAYRYRVIRIPGYYCCHCNARFEVSKHAYDHVEQEHKGVESPDSQNPSGYMWDSSYTCKRER